MRIIREWDVRSLYPSIMINFNMLSRNVPSVEEYSAAYHKRIEAKKSDDKKTSEALKLVLNIGF